MRAFASGYGAQGKTGGVGQKDLEEERKTLKHFLSQQRALQLRVDAIEQELGVEGASNSAGMHVTKIECIAQAS